jgi:hypothetical protein
MKIHLRQLLAGIVISRPYNNGLAASGEKGVGEIVDCGFFKAEAFDQGMHIMLCFIVTAVMLIPFYRKYISHKNESTRSNKKFIMTLPRQEPGVS